MEALVLSSWSSSSYRLSLRPGRILFQGLGGRESMTKAHYLESSFQRVSSSE